MQHSKAEYFSIIPSEFKLDGGAMFGIIPKPLWEKKIPSDKSNRINMALRVFVVKIADRVILIDSGIGDYHQEKFQQRHNITDTKSPLEVILKEQLKINADEITDIIPSHLHFDHVGGFLKVQAEQVTGIFQNATLHLHKKHYEYSLNPTPRDQGSFQYQYFKPLIDEYTQKKQVNWLEGDSGVILNTGDYQLNYRCSHGHTPFQIHPFDKEFIFMADLMPTHAHISPVWVMGYDMQPGIGPNERVEFYQFIEENQLTMIYDHDLEYWGSKIQHGQKGYQAKDLHPQQHPHFQQVLIKD